MSLPKVGEPLNGGGPTSGNWSRWFSFVDQTLSQLSTTTTTPTESSPTKINQGNGIQVTGNPGNGYTISLRTIYATNVVYSNTDSGLDATNVQAAIDEVAGFGVPYFLPDGTTYTVPENKQALFTIPIELDGTASLDVSGYLVEVG